MGWHIISESVIGASHKRQGLPLQDAIMSMRDKDFLYVALADGHGSKLCFRSDIGASLATLCAIEIVKHQARSVAKLQNIKDRELALRNILQAISADWARQVMRDLRSNPFQTEELDNLTSEYQKKLSTNALVAYGSTLSLLVLNRKNIFGFCLGDGDALFKLKDGIELVEDKRMANADSTDSLCQSKSLINARYFDYDTKLVDCLILSTDGYKNSFDSSEDFKKVIDDMHTILKEHGAETIRKSLYNWLDETSIKGSGDDITACFLYNEA